MTRCVWLILALTLLSCREVPRPKPASTPTQETSTPPATRRSELARAFPADVTLFVETTPSAPGLPMVKATLHALLGGERVPEAKALVDAAEVIASGIADLKTQRGATAIRLSDEAPLRAWVAAAQLTSQGADTEVERFELPEPLGLVWMAQERLLIVGMGDLVDQSVNALLGKRSSLAAARGGEIEVPREAGTILYLDLPSLHGKFSKPLTASIRAREGGGTEIHASTASKPWLAGLTLEPVGDEVATILPEETFFYAALGGASSAIDLPLIPSELSGLLAAVDRIVVFAAAVEDYQIDPHREDPTEGLAFGLLARMREGQAVSPEQLAKLQQTFASRGLSVEQHRGHLLVAGGSSALLSRVRPALEGERTLAASAKHQPITAAKAQLRVWADAGAIVSFTSHLIPPQSLQLLGNLDALDTTELSVTADLGEDQWRYDIGGSNVMSAAAMIGTASAIAMHAFRRYLELAKVNEAKSTLALIGRAAIDAQQRTGKLCRTSISVPEEVPTSLYEPSREPGRDYQSGTAQQGWNCLGFSIEGPQRYRYQYVTGGPGVKSRVDGSPLPAGRFEVVAEGDLDGDGETSLLVRQGNIEGGTAKLSPQVFLSNQLE